MDIRGTGLISQCKAVIEQRARWEYIEIDREDDFLPDLGGPMPLLRHLHVELGYDSILDAPQFPDVPLLRSVILDELAASRISLPWSQLTSLTLRDCLLSITSPILQQTSSLIDCNLDLYSNDPDDYVAPTKTLLHLRSLTLSMDSDIAYLETFAVPALSALCIPESLLLPDPVGSLTSFIQKSHCRLQDVRITGFVSIPRTTYKDAFPSIQFSFDRRHRTV
ncbi:hypothetical protein C8R46DRAFT_360792 [Mycena filopes]|nr:hypothetical protein C8R46DRAFT_360792 [Mycena filopes]